MRVLLSAVGTRGDVQPLVAVAVRLRELGHQVRLCVPPNLVEWTRGFGFESHAVGVEMRQPKTDKPAAPLTEEQLRQLRATMPDLITDQFEKVGAAAEGSDVILGANAHQYAARSIAELLDIPYVNALYAPVSIPSPDLAPPPGMGQLWEPGEPDTNLERWAENLQVWNGRSLERVNHNRVRLGLAPIDDVLSFNITDHPWLATDPILAPLPTTPGRTVFETGAWILEDSTPLSQELTEFLNSGEPPIYFGFGSMPAPKSVAHTLIDAARDLGRRAIISQGWADLDIGDDNPDCIVIGDVNQQLLFPRVAAIVHHGGAGTTATASRAGVPQVVTPMFSDQFYWASRVRALEIGSSVIGGLTPEGLAIALQEALAPSVVLNAQLLTQRLSSDGAMVAAQRLVKMLKDRNV